MRLSNREVETIKRCAAQRFGARARVWLFGSRVDDQRRGGDIDLYVESDIADPNVLVDARLRFLTDLYLGLGEQKIDVVIRRLGGNVELPIYEIAKNKGIKLV